MIEPTRGLVLRQLKYGETSLITTVFTERFGVRSYMMKGVRSPRNKTLRVGLLQTCSLLDLVVDHRPGRQLQQIREFSLHYFPQQLQEDVARNSIAVFCTEVLAKLLPEGESMPELFEFCYEFMVRLDKATLNEIANFPVYFLVRCGRFLGYAVQGRYAAETNFANAVEGCFAAAPGNASDALMDEDALALEKLLLAEEFADLERIQLSGATRYRLVVWYVQFLQAHTQHMGKPRSLEILRSVLYA
jgi:DNA repair protein RecO (recombination protein O)